MMRVLVVVALAACSIKPIDYTGKQCPCPEDYDCNRSTNTCTKQLVGDAGNDSQDATDGSVIQGDSCLPNPKSNLVYSSVGFTDFPQAWLGSSGQWNLEQGEVKGTNATLPIAWLSHSIGNSNANYRVVATMRLIAGFSDAGLGIAFRVSGMQGNLYTCTIAPGTGQLELKSWQQGTDLPVASKTVSITDANAMLTMEINIDGMNMTCCLRGYPTAMISGMNGSWISGSVGVATTEAQAAFGSLWAYQ
ncbi:MAG TPA: hypothetical protein VIV11_37620 [Kofleriaceae bacterium]